MNRLVLAVALVGCCLALPQQRQGGTPAAVNPHVKILDFESFQDGANYGHSLRQEDGTATGQKVGPDGLVYGFYSYIQDNGKPVKVYYRAGQGIGYEVLKTEGISSNLGNLKGHISENPQQDIAPRPRSQAQQPTRNVHHAIAQTLPRHQPAPIQHQQPAQVHHQQPAPVIHQQPTPVVRQQPAPVVRHQPILNQPIVPRAPHPVPQRHPLVPQEHTPAPHRFDYPANLNLQRTGSGFRSSFKAL